MAGDIGRKRDYVAKYSVKLRDWKGGEISSEIHVEKCKW